MDGGFVKVDCKCGHVPRVGCPRYLQVVILHSPSVTRFRNSSMESGVGRVGFPGSSVVRGSYRAY